MMHLIDSAIGALRLYALHVQHPTTIAQDLALDAGAEAITRLQLVGRDALQLAEAYTAVRAITEPHLTVTVAPPNRSGLLTAMIHDGPHLMQTVLAKTPEGLAELLRVRIQEAQAA